LTLRLLVRQRLGVAELGDPVEVPFDATDVRFFSQH
jgi:hypothetical protein